MIANTPPATEMKGIAETTAATIPIMEPVYILLTAAASSRLISEALRSPHIFQPHEKIHIGHYYQYACYDIQNPPYYRDDRENRGQDTQKRDADKTVKGFFNT